MFVFSQVCRLLQLQSSKVTLSKSHENKRRKLTMYEYNKPQVNCGSTVRGILIGHARAVSE